MVLDTRFLGLVVVAVLLVVAARARDVHYPACSYCDAYLYGADAKSLSENGLHKPLTSGGLRTVGYPAFVALVTDTSDASRTNAFQYGHHGVAIVQTTIFIAAVLGLVAALLPLSRGAAWSAAIGLLANPFVLQYLPLRMTEGLTAGLVVAFVAVAAAVSFGKPRPSQRLAALALCGLIVGVATIVRPASVILIPTFALFLLLTVRGTPGVVGSVAVAVGALVLPLLFQCVVNEMAHGRFTPFPVANLGSFQITNGLASLKYATDLTGATAQGVRYPSPFFTPNEIAQFGTFAYLRQPVDGLLTLFFHAFGSIDHDSFFTYIYRRPALAESFANLAAHFGIGAAAASAGYLVAGAVRKRLPISSFWIVPASLVVFTLALNSVTIPEVRFGLIVYLVAGPFAVYGLRETANRSAIIACGASYAAVAMVLSGWMRSLIGG